MSAPTATTSSPRRDMDPNIGAPDSAVKIEKQRSKLSMQSYMYIIAYTYSRGCWCSTCVYRGRSHRAWSQSGREAH